MLTKPIIPQTSALCRLLRSDDAAIEFSIADGPVSYAEAMAAMEARVKAIAEGRAREAVWLVEHPALYTAGTSARPEDLLDADKFEVHTTGRGGQYTYHGPGQRVAYVMLDLKNRGRDVRCFVQNLEDLVIETLAAFNVRGERRAGRIGVWVPRPERGAGVEDKISAIGVRVSRWVTWHGLSLNVSVDLDDYSGIVPCGIRDHGVTSLEDLGQTVGMKAVDSVLRTGFGRLFGALEAVHSPLNSGSSSV